LARSVALSACLQKPLLKSDKIKFAGPRARAPRPNFTSGRAWRTFSPANDALLQGALEALDITGEFLRSNLGRGDLRYLFHHQRLNGETPMTRILFVGQKPETVDFSDPSLPPGFNAEKINAGIALGVSKIEERGWQGDTCMITPDAAGSAALEKALKRAAYDCVVIGGGLRLPPKSLALFETVVNIIHKAAPNAAIAFNTRPEDTADAAARQLKAG
jgi:hypothetical protein